MHRKMGGSSRSVGRARRPRSQGVVLDLFPLSPISIPEVEDLRGARHDLPFQVPNEDGLQQEGGVRVSPSASAREKFRVA